MTGSEWEQIHDDEWRRGDAVRLTRTGQHWQAFTRASKQIGPRLLDSEWAMRLCDFGAFEPDVRALYDLPDPAGIPALQNAIRHLHGVEATWLESVFVHEQTETIVWRGEVQVFAVEHPQATRVYAWSHRSEAGKRRFHSVLAVKPVVTAEMAVRTAVFGDLAR